MDDAKHHANKLVSVRIYNGWAKAIFDWCTSVACVYDIICSAQFVSTSKLEHLPKTFTKKRAPNSLAYTGAAV